MLWLLLVFVPLVSLWSSGVGNLCGCCLFLSLWFLFGLPVLVILWLFFFIPLASLWSSGAGYFCEWRLYLFLWFLFGLPVLVSCCLFLFLWFLSGLPVLDIFVVVVCFCPFGFSLVFRCWLFCGC